jgi:protein-disulfide isomerase
MNGHVRELNKCALARADLTRRLLSAIGRTANISDPNPDWRQNVLPGLARIVLTLVALAIFSPPFAAAEPLSTEQKKAVEETVREYLLAHPELIVEALETMQARQKEAKERRQLDFLSRNNESIRFDANSFVTGNPKGDVTIVEFFDYRCGYCKKFHPVMTELLKTDKNIRVVLKEFPILGPDSNAAAQAAIAALRLAPERYLDFHNGLMEARGKLSKSRIQDIAAETGLDIKQMAAAMASPEIRKIVEANYGQAKNLGINGTPGFVVGDTIVPGFINLAQMRSLVAEARADCKTC